MNIKNVLSSFFVLRSTLFQCIMTLLLPQAQRKFSKCYFIGVSLFHKYFHYHLFARTPGLDYEIPIQAVQFQSLSMRRSSLAFPCFGNDVVWDIKYFIVQLQQAKPSIEFLAHFGVLKFVARSAEMFTLSDFYRTHKA